MNTNYLISYVNLDGKEYIRTGLRKITVVIFAGFKFLFDRIFAAIGLVLLAPLFMLITLIIKLDSKGPALFTQVRTGKGGKNIRIYKFRTMVAGNDVHDFSKCDQHTRIGNFLRRTSLDEIPQLISIFKGDMSFIGPRPWIPDYYENMNETQRHRYSVRPGLTGLAQANGRNAINIFDKIKYDLEYIEKYSMMQDIKVVLLTIKSIFKGTGNDAGKGGIQKDIEDLKEYNKKQGI